MWPIGFMAWRIGQVLDLNEQITWVKAAGFDGIGLHASPGVAGQWRGIAPEAADAAYRRQLCQTLGDLAFVELHAPFALALCDAELQPIVEALEPVLDLAADLGAQIVTVHANPPQSPNALQRKAWEAALARLGTSAASRDVIVGLEIVRGFHWITSPCSPHLGVTLDVGHLYQNESEPLREGGGLRSIVQALDGSLCHIHLHQVMGSQDHWAPGSVPDGKGLVDYATLFSSLRSINYLGGLNLEINPDLADPEEIAEARVWIQARVMGVQA